MKKQSFTSKKWLAIAVLGLALTLGTQESFAQTTPSTTSTSVSAIKTISGTIYNENNEAMPVANIVIKGTQNGTTSDSNGKFEIDAKEGDVLEISFLGYATKKYNVKSSHNTAVSVKMEVKDFSFMGDSATDGVYQEKSRGLKGMWHKITGKND